MTKQIVTRGDDAGSCVSANRALYEAAKAGVLKNIGVMVAGPAFAECVDSLKELKNVDLGLHSTITSEWDDVRWGPILKGEVPSLVQGDGTFYCDSGAVHKNHGRIDEIIAEINAQYEVGRKFGLEFRYLDEHMGFGWIPGLREVMTAWAKEKNLVYFSAIEYLDLDYKSQSNENRLVAAVESSSDCVQVCVTHPAFPGGDLARFGHQGYGSDAIRIERDGDRQMLMSAQTLAAIHAGKFKPVRYTDLV